MLGWGVLSCVHIIPIKSSCVTSLPKIVWKYLLYEENAETKGYPSTFSPKIFLKMAHNKAHGCNRIPGNKFPPKKIPKLIS